MAHCAHIPDRQQCWPVLPPFRSSPRLTLWLCAGPDLPPLADYANPAAYFLQALVVNEFESPSWGFPVQEGLGAPAGMTEGVFYMKER